ncbi:hypothetical protein GSI_14048 [Ganoderma sinense ZZ0214-1]|uniref:Uncharacterized protein n=1 Tax=Ganoderma sinense ZZ0214-1 TaxID=1077348 RepID=A0A2G8RS02_9APHY|nr:hypothetical protein GSI_14048 [Ganoderma sinense ZZ0214-1]
MNGRDQHVGGGGPGTLGGHDLLSEKRELRGMRKERTPGFARPEKAPFACHIADCECAQVALWSSAAAGSRSLHCTGWQALNGVFTIATAAGSLQRAAWHPSNAALDACDRRAG